MKHFMNMNNAFFTLFSAYEFMGYKITKIHFPMNLGGVSAEHKN